MTLDRRDWIEDGCKFCGWGIRGREENVRMALERHECNPLPMSIPWFREQGAAPYPLQASESPSNATESSPSTLTMEYSSGVRRTPNDGKINWSLVFDGPLVRRLAEHLTKGEKTHGKRNWMKGETEEDLERFRESAARHFLQWWYGETDEDHFAATVFNMNGAELVKERLADE